jgi:hypothetical protein
MRNLNYIYISFFLLIFIFYSNNIIASESNVSILKKETAIKIAVAVWTKIYGKDHIAEQKPYIASLEDGIWCISGTLPKKYTIGSTAYAEIIKESGKIIRVSHGK